MSYIDYIKAQFKNSRTAILTIIFTIARIIYGWSWVNSGWGKATSGWLNFDGGHAAKLISSMAKNIVPPAAHGLDPLHINSLWSWVAIHIFNGMPAFTDFLVPISEMVVGILMIVGFQLFWAAILGLFLNVQFIAAGSANNFGYIWTNIIVMNSAKYAELIGLSGFLRYKKEVRQKA